jgi:UDP-N-acetylmuramate-alanine ligase
MADHGTVGTYSPPQAQGISGYGLSGISWGLVAEHYPPEGGDLDASPTTGQLWPRGNP